MYTQDSERFTEKDLLLKEAVADFKVTYEEELQNTKLHVECKAVLKSLKNHWDGLLVFVKHPVIPMDNNESLCAFSKLAHLNPSEK